VIRITILNQPEYLSLFTSDIGVKIGFVIYLRRFCQKKDSIENPIVVDWSVSPGFRSKINVPPLVDVRR
jgi:hypothetical protein